jgi:hypothetical protein
VVGGVVLVGVAVALFLKFVRKGEAEPNDDLHGTDLVEGNTIGDEDPDHDTEFSISQANALDPQGDPESGD